MAALEEFIERCLDGLSHQVGGNSLPRTAYRHRPAHSRAHRGDGIASLCPQRPLLGNSTTAQLASVLVRIHIR
jgi:hypothetical protein